MSDENDNATTITNTVASIDETLVASIVPTVVAEVLPIGKVQKFGLCKQQGHNKQNYLNQKQPLPSTTETKPPVTDMVVVATVKNTSPLVPVTTPVL